MAFGPFCETLLRPPLSKRDFILLGSKVFGDFPTTGIESSANKEINGIGWPFPIELSQNSFGETSRLIFQEGSKEEEVEGSSVNGRSKAT